jgi:hypothetical protein
LQEKQSFGRFKPPYFTHADSMVAIHDGGPTGIPGVYEMRWSISGPECHPWTRNAPGTGLLLQVGCMHRPSRLKSSCNMGDLPPTCYGEDEW